MDAGRTKGCDAPACNVCAVNCGVVRFIVVSFLFLLNLAVGLTVSCGSPFYTRRENGLELGWAGIRVFLSFSCSWFLKGCSVAEAH